MLDQMATRAPTPDAAITLETLSIEPYWLLRSGTAKKLGKQSKGSIAYQLLTNDARQEVWLTITSNDGGGYFSHEMVGLAAVQTCISGISPQTAVSFKAASNGFYGP